MSYSEMIVKNPRVLIAAVIANIGTCILLRTSTQLEIGAGAPPMIVLNWFVELRERMAQGGKP